MEGREEGRGSREKEETLPRFGAKNSTLSLKTSLYMTCTATRLDLDRLIIHKLIHQILERAIRIHKLRRGADKVIGDVTHAAEEGVFGDPRDTVHPVDCHQRQLKLFQNLAATTTGEGRMNTNPYQQ